MANSINYAAVFNRILDEKFYILPRTMWMENTNPGIVWEGGKEVKIPMLGMDGLGNMNGYKAPQGDLSLDWETKTLQWYRGRNFSIGRYDVDETNFALTVGNALRVFLNEHVVPEVDSLRIAMAAQGAISYGQTVVQASSGITTANILGLLLADIAKVQDKIGENEQLYIQISTGLKSLLEQSTQITRYLNVKDFQIRSAVLQLNALNDQYLIGTPSKYMLGVSQSMRYMYLRFTLQSSSSVRSAAYPCSMNPYRTVFSILTRLYPGRPILPTGRSRRYCFTLASSISLSNTNTGSQMSKKSAKNTGNLPCFALLYCCW